jgi:hypothetical protein
LEEHRRERRPLGHFTSIVRVPHDIPHEAWDAWLVSQPCACGRTYCDHRRVGVLLPETCESPEEWEAHYGRWMEEYG